MYCTSKIAAAEFHPLCYMLHLYFSFRFPNKPKREVLTISILWMRKLKLRCRFTKSPIASDNLNWTHRPRCLWQTAPAYPSSPSSRFPIHSAQFLYNPLPYPTVVTYEMNMMLWGWQGVTLKLWKSWKSSWLCPDFLGHLGKVICHAMRTLTWPVQALHATELRPSANSQLTKHCMEEPTKAGLQPLMISCLYPPVGPCTRTT